MADRVSVTVWNEFRDEKAIEAVKKIYPAGIHAVIAEHLKAQQGITVRTATLDEPEQGLSEEVVNNTDVMVWLSHMAHEEVADAAVARLHERVLQGMGFVCFHAVQLSKIFKRLMGTTCLLKWGTVPEKERLWNLEPGHPITEGIGEYFELPQTEMYCERFDIPTPDKLIFVSWFERGAVFRSGCVWERGHGRIFYFRPGHETYPIFYDENVKKVITNAVRWAAPRVLQPHACRGMAPLENIAEG